MHTATQKHGSADSALKIALSNRSLVCVSKTRHNSSFILQIHELKSKKTWLEAYRNSCLLLIDPWAAIAAWPHTQTRTLSYISLAHAHWGIIIASITVDCVLRSILTVMDQYRDCVLLLFSHDLLKPSYNINLPSCWAYLTGSGSQDNFLAFFL